MLFRHASLDSIDPSFILFSLHARDWWVFQMLPHLVNSFSYFALLYRLFVEIIICWCIVLHRSETGCGETKFSNLSLTWLEITGDLVLVRLLNNIEQFCRFFLLSYYRLTNFNRSVRVQTRRLLWVSCNRGTKGYVLWTCEVCMRTCCVLTRQSVEKSSLVALNKRV